MFARLYILLCVIEHRFKDKTKHKIIKVFQVSHFPRSSKDRGVFFRPVRLSTRLSVHFNLACNLLTFDLYQIRGTRTMYLESIFEDRVLSERTLYLTL